MPVTLLSETCRRVFEKMEGAAKRSGRDVRDITLVAATKTVPLSTLREAVACKVTCFGENRVQEARAKFVDSGFLKETGVSLHLIGPLQRNKVRQAVGLFDLIHSVDSIALATRINEVAGQTSHRQAVLVEVNIGAEEGKHGASIAATPELVAVIRAFPHLSLLGLMAIPPPVTDPNAARPYFVALRDLGESLGLHQFSMGMSNDFEVAIEEGATWVRVGTKIFGEQ